MPTIGEALRTFEDRLFVGRENEVARFEAWLEQEPFPPHILNVSGPGGIGKSSLLHVFRRIAQNRGRQVVYLDARDFRATPESFWRALGGDSADDVLGRLNKARPLLLIDTFEEIGDLSRFLQKEFLSHLDTSVKVAIAGRYPLATIWSHDDLWRELIEPLPLEGLSNDEGHAFLKRRGLSEPGIVEQVLRAAGGHPLALSLAADLAVQLGSRDFTTFPEWRLSVRSLVERLLRHVPDEGLRELLEGASMIRQFDEATLAAISGHEEITAAFDQLCRLSVVRPAEHGLMLHDDVRRALADDLRWRNQTRYQELRQRALAYYRERFERAPLDDREWLMTERFFLWENAFIQSILFNRDEQGEVWLDVGGPDNRDEVLNLEAFWQDNVFPSTVSLPQSAVFDREAHLAIWREFLLYSGLRLRIARDRHGKALGFNLMAPVCQESIALLKQHDVLTPLLDAYLASVQREGVARTAEDANVYYLVQAAFTVGLSEVTPEAINAALLRDIFSVVARRGVCLCSAGIEAHRKVLSALGFVEIPDTQAYFRGCPMSGYMLDLTRIGVEAWIEAAMSGRRPPRAFAPAELERELQSALLHWHDDDQLARSPLLESSFVGQEAPCPTTLRNLIRGTIERARAQAGERDDLPLRALELGYLSRNMTHEQAAERLAVSRTTFYRLVKRGIQGISADLSALN